MDKLREVKTLGCHSRIEVYQNGNFFININKCITQIGNGTQDTTAEPELCSLTRCT